MLCLIQPPAKTAYLFQPTPIRSTLHAISCKTNPIYPVFRPKTTFMKKNEPNSNPIYTQGMKNNLELLPTKGSSRGRAKSSSPRRQGQNCRRRSQSYVEDDFNPTTQESCFAAGRSRAGCWDTLKNNAKRTQFIPFLTQKQRS